VGTGGSILQHGGLEAITDRDASRRWRRQNPSGRGTTVLPENIRSTSFDALACHIETAVRRGGARDGDPGQRREQLVATQDVHIPLVDQ
jgi:hypothetical protein